MARAMLIRSTAILAVVFLLSGCATSSHTLIDDGVYLGSAHQTHLSARQAAILDPRSYPFWSIDFFYFSHFYGPLGARALYDPPLHPATGPCDGWAKHLCLEELYSQHLAMRLRLTRDDFRRLTKLDREPTVDHRLQALNAGPELHLMHRVSQARHAVADRRQVALQQHSRLDAQTVGARSEAQRSNAAQRHATSQQQSRLGDRNVTARSTAQRDRGAAAQRMRGDRSHSSGSRSSSRMTAARSSHLQGGASSRGSAAAVSSASTSQIER